ncbi:MAG: proton-translocating transhydrogenase family protein [Pseudomonadota bacterium]
MANQDREEIEAAADATRTLADEAKEVANAALSDAEAKQVSAEELEALAQKFELATDLLNSPSEIVYLLGIFVLAIFVGYYVVWSVTPALHTPLMSVTNAISSVVVVGALIALGADLTEATTGFWPKTFGFLGVALASVNIFGGFMVTQRMLAMYKKKER